MKVGDGVKRDQVIVFFSQENTTYQQAKIQVENAVTSFSRMEKLYWESGVSKQDYDNARTQLSVARESLCSREEMILQCRVTYPDASSRFVHYNFLRLFGNFFFEQTKIAVIITVYCKHSYTSVCEDVVIISRNQIFEVFRKSCKK